MRATHVLVPALLAAALSGCDGTAATSVAAGAEPRFACNDSGPCFDPPETLWWYGSDTDLVNGWSFNPDVHKGWSWTHSDSDLHVGIRVDATAYWYLNCAGNPQFHAQKSASAPYGHAEVSFRREISAVTNDGYQVRGTHTFTRKSGGTPLVYYSEASHCDNGW